MRNDRPLAPPILRELRSFGLAVGGVFSTSGAWWFYRGKFGFIGPACLTVGLTMIALVAVAPHLLTIPNKAWMSLAEGVGWVMTRVILVVVFALVVTPIGLLRRLVGADPLRRRLRPSPGRSAWHTYPARQLDTRHYEKMY